MACQCVCESACPTNFAASRETTEPTGASAGGWPTARRHFSNVSLVPSFRVATRLPVSSAWTWRPTTMSGMFTGVRKSVERMLCKKWDDTLLACVLDEGLVSFAWAVGERWISRHSGVIRRTSPACCASSKTLRAAFAAVPPPQIRYL